MADGSFTPAARAAIYEAGGGRCLGCGGTNLTAQHRRARGMGGTRDVTRGHPANGLPLCGSGTTGCHGWTEDNPIEAALLGWRLEGLEEATVAPWWSHTLGWRRWTVDELVAYVDVDDLDRLEERRVGVATFRDRPVCWHG